MFEKEFQEWFERNKKWLYSSDHMQAAYHAWCAGVQQQNAAQPTLAPDGAGLCANCSQPEINHPNRMCDAFDPPRR